MRIRLRRRTKAAYTRLFDDPYSLFPGCEVTLFPNGEPEIWVRMDGGRGFRITGSNGPAAAMLAVEALQPGHPTDVASNASVPTPVDAEALRPRVEVLQYKPDAWSQQFRRWCRAEANYPGEQPVGTNLDASQGD